MKKLVVAMLALGLMLTGCSSSSDKAKDLTKVKIGAIQLAQHPALDKAYQGFKDTLVDAGISEDQITFKNANGDQSNCTTIAEKLVNDGNDLIYAIATPALQAVANKTTEIPVVGSAVTNFEVAGVVKSNDKPETNVTGASDLNPVKEQIDLLKTLIPNAKKIAVFYCSAEANSVYQGKLAVEAAKKAGLEATIETVSESNEIQQKTESLVGKYDAVYVPTDNLLAENMSTVTQVANEHNLPCIVGEIGMCEQGGLATLSLDYYTVGVNAGKQALAILKGESKPQDMAISVVEAKDCKYYINTTTAKKLGIKIPDEINSKATKLK